MLTQVKKISGSFIIISNQISLICKIQEIELGITKVKYKKITQSIFFFFKYIEKHLFSADFLALKTLF